MNFLSFRDPSHTRCSNKRNDIKNHTNNGCYPQNNRLRLLHMASHVDPDLLIGFFSRDFSAISCSGERYHGLCLYRNARNDSLHCNDSVFAEIAPVGCNHSSLINIFNERNRFEIGMNVDAKDAFLHS